MFQEMPFLKMLINNLLLIGLWQGITVFACQHLPDSLFDARRTFYHPRKWEQNGRWYRSHLKIQDWKDRLPQFISNGGFSKRSLGNTLTLEYIDRFILETCRGEWMHTLGGFCLIPIIWLNTPLVSITISIPLFLGTWPFIIIQRYNRFRLQVLQKRLVREQSHEQHVSVPT